MGEKFITYIQKLHRFHNHYTLKNQYKDVKDNEKIGNHINIHFIEKKLKSSYEMMFIKVIPLVLAGVAQWIERQPENKRVIGSIPSQSTCLVCRPGPL